VIDMSGHEQLLPGTIFHVLAKTKERRVKMRHFIVSILVAALSLGMVGLVHATDWQITGYIPQSVSVGKAYKTVTINGSFSTYREGRKVKIGAGGKVIYDLSSRIIVWTLGQVKVVLPGAISTGQYWLAIYTPDDQLLVKGPETLKVVKTVRFVPINYRCPQGWVLKSGSVNYKKGSFECVPKKQKLQCPSGTTYYETECTIGCQAVPW